MKKIIQTISMLACGGAALLLSACSKQSDVPVPHEIGNSIRLDISASRSEGARFVWDFQAENRGEHNIQIVSEGELGKPAPSVVIEIGDQTFSEALKSTFVIEEDGVIKTVSQIMGTVSFKQVGSRQLSLTNSAAFEAVRMLPSVRNRIGTGEFEKEWRVMHESPEKQAALEWFKGAKFGMFIHWGLYSQAAGSWKGTRIEEAPYPGPKVAEWLMLKFRIPRDEYAELAKTFNPDKSFARNIARMQRMLG